MAAPTRDDLVRLIRAELADCDGQVAYQEKRATDVLVVHGVGHEMYALALVRVQFYEAQAAAWRDFARRLRDLLAEMGES